MSEARFVDGIRAFADRYHGFVLDQWGVIHDGVAALPEALAAIAELKRRGKRVALLSNSGRRAELNRRRLAALGFNVADFDAVVTSGEVAWRHLSLRALEPFASFGRRCLLFTIGGDLGVVEGLGLELVDAADAADFLFVTGLEVPPRTLADHDATLEAAAVRGLPLLCSNPDLVAPVAGELVVAPGSLAARYAELGGPVHFVGKPHRLVYGACLDALDGLEPGEIVAIGDSMAHDVKGANDAGLASCFVAGGIHAADFPVGQSFPARARTVADLGARHGAAPDWAVKAFAW
jgi:HAD superfamily hydrolase (TIGR01459 family)